VAAYEEAIAECALGLNEVFDGREDSSCVVTCIIKNLVMNKVSYKVKEETKSTKKRKAEKPKFPDSEDSS